MDYVIIHVHKLTNLLQLKLLEQIILNGSVLLVQLNASAAKINYVKTVLLDFIISKDNASPLVQQVTLLIIHKLNV
jgi:hypothetical protein